MRIWREYSFEAAHWLPYVSEDHKCRNLHGHSWRVEVHVVGDVDATTGWVCDFAGIDAAWAPLYAILDHGCLNEIEGLENPTSEVLAVWIWRNIRVPGLLSHVVVRETARSGCEYSGE